MQKRRLSSILSFGDLASPIVVPSFLGLHVFSALSATGQSWGDSVEDIKEAVKVVSKRGVCHLLGQTQSYNSI